MKACPSYPGYSATEDGKIISHRRRGCGRQRGSTSCIDPTFQYELSQFTTGKGYRTVCIMLPNKKSRPVGVHQLVADAFLGPRPDGNQVRHLNGNPSDNKPVNLSYGTAIENAADRLAHGTYLEGSNHHGAKLSADQAAEIRRRRKTGEKVKALASAFQVSVSTIETLLSGKSHRPKEFKRVQP